MKSLGYVVLLLNVASATSHYVLPYKVRPLVPNATKVQHRVYGGTEATDGQFPFMALALMSLGPYSYSKCSSSLISSEWVLLAAHCLYFPSLRPKDILLFAGKADLYDYIRERVIEGSFYDLAPQTSNGVQVRRAKEFFIHPQYQPPCLDHDVSLIRVSFPFSLGSVQTIPISLDKIRTLKTCTILGWGLTRGNYDNLKLNFVEGKTVSTTEIGCNHKPSGPFICLKQDGTGICAGDSGSPLVCDGKVWGVASHYVALTENADCGDSLEEYYSELHSDLSWIKSVYGGGSVAETSLKTVLLCLVCLWMSAKR